MKSDFQMNKHCRNKCTDKSQNNYDSDNNYHEMTITLQFLSLNPVEYVDDATEPRHRYYGNRLHARPHTATDEKPPEMTKTNFRQGSPPSRSALQGSSRNPLTHNGHHSHGNAGDRELSGLGAGSQAVQPEEMEPEPPGEEQLIRTAPYVHIRSGVESFQPIAAAIAMQENLNSLEEEADETGPASRPPPEHVPTSGKNSIDAIQPEPPAHSKFSHVDSAVKDNEVLHQNGEDGFEKALAEKEVQAALLQTKTKDDSETTSLTEVYFLGLFGPILI